MDRVKHQGKCAYCGEMVMPRIIEENDLRRDKCKCPLCGNFMYVCRTPGCNNYARSGSMYDDELCSDCTSSVVSQVGTAVSFVVTAVISKKI